jgi:hypothetical protein
MTLLGCSAPSQKPEVAKSAPTNDPRARESAYADVFGWTREWDRGAAIIKGLESLSEEQRKSYDVSAFRGETVAFVGGAAPWGGPLDLRTLHGYDLRVKDKGGSMRGPQALSWSAEVRGKIMQVLPVNRMIVLDVEDRHWRVVAVD